MAISYPPTENANKDKGNMAPKKESEGQLGQDRPNNYKSFIDYLDY